MADSSAPRVELAPGTGLVGAVFKARDRDVPVFAFKGIPYAQPPVGELRFEPPRPVELWTGDRQATEYGPVCIQDVSIYDKIQWNLTVAKNMSEDCLFLNVWTTTLDPGAKKPVLFWIHGGSFMGGWGNLFEGTAICTFEEVVFVSINYRCGLFGFLCTGDDVVPGNNGLRDQIEALRWVQKYIQRFGGDPNNVTIYGGSAGAMSVSALMLSDQAAGLFHKAISQSGTVRCPGFMWSQDYAKDQVMPVLHRMGLKTENSKEIKSFLKEQTLDFIIKNLKDSDNFRPVIDNSLLRAECIENCTSATATHIPYITGCNSHEGALYVQIWFGFKLPNRQALQKGLKVFYENLFNMDKLDVDGLTTDIMKEYFEGASDEQLIERYTEMVGDAWYVMPCVVGADSHCGTTYAYYLSEPQSASQYPPWVLSDHAADFGLTMGCPLYDYSHHTKVWQYNEQEAELSKQMMKYWANFARTGNPNGAGLPEWPKYERTDRAYINLKKNATVDRNLKESQIQFWKDVITKYSSAYIK